MNIMNKNTLQPKNLAKDNGDFSLLGDRSLSNLEAQTRNMQDLLRIGLLEDNPIESEALKNLFPGNNFRVQSYSTGKSMIEALKSESFDLVVLDWNLPDSNGVQVLRHIRNNLNSSCVVLMLTCRQSEYDVVHALDNGADDFIQKPWRDFELLARINALLRRRRSIPINQIDKFGQFIINPLTRNVWRDGKAIKFSPKEFDLFHLLVLNINCPVSRSHITNSVWRGESTDGRVVDVYISRVRLKARLTAEYGYRLHSIYGFGYQLDSLSHIE